ncbi:MAG: hypothetical protein E7228_06745 [Clostridiales bacterium]|nr:hypothetical protein [Clostridiales bacterium]
MNETLKREAVEKIRIGALCSDCTDPTAKVMTSYVFDLKNIISLGMFEKALIATEVLVEQGGDPHTIAKETVFPEVNEMLRRYNEKEVNKVELIKALEAADTAVKVLKREAPDESETGPWKEWDRFLKKTISEYYGFVLP